MLTALLCITAFGAQNLIDAFTTGENLAFKSLCPS